jgi:hypothetical protein
MSDRIIAKAQSEGWTDLFINEGKVWGYRQPSDVMPQQYPEQELRVLHDFSLGISCPATLVLDGVEIRGTYAKEPHGYWLSGDISSGWNQCMSLGGGRSFFDFESSIEADYIALRKKTINREFFDAYLLLQIPEQYREYVEWTSARVSCIVETLMAQVPIDISLRCSGKLSLHQIQPEATRTAHIPAAPVQPVPMQHPQP